MAIKWTPNATTPHVGPCAKNAHGAHESEWHKAHKRPDGPTIHATDQRKEFDDNPQESPLAASRGQTTKEPINNI